MLPRPTIVGLFYTFVMLTTVVTMMTSRSSHTLVRAYTSTRTTTRMIVGGPTFGGVGQFKAHHQQHQHQQRHFTQQGGASTTVLLSSNQQQQQHHDIEIESAASSSLINNDTFDINEDDDHELIFEEEGDDVVAVVDESLKMGSSDDATITITTTTTIIENDDTASSNDDDGGGGNVDMMMMKKKKNMRVLLKEELRQYRIDQSSRSKKPAYTVFTNVALDEICTTLPETEDELLAVKGIGMKKLKMYGQDILDIVHEYTSSSGGEEGRPEEGDDDDKEGLRRSSGRSVVPRPTRISIESLTMEQRRVAEIALDIDNPSNVFISGAAGTGKSHVLKYIIQTLQEERPTLKCAATAPTGVAAINVGGSTLHSFFGIGLGVGSLQSLVKKVKKNKDAMKRINETDVLLIDEVSMLSSDLLEIIDTVVREIRYDGTCNHIPMGGIQIIAVGDFFQLPPIMNNNNNKNSNRDLIDNVVGGRWEEDIDDDYQRHRHKLFAFDSPIWSELGLLENTFELTQVQRQESGSKFELFLNMVRVGTVTSDIIRDLNYKCLISKLHPLPDDGIIPTRIYTHNRDVDVENETRLSELEGKPKTFTAVDEWKEKMPIGTIPSVKKNMKAGIASELPDEVLLKVGAQVMLTRNKDLERGIRGLVNGSRGVVERFDDDDQLPIVRFDNGRIHKITRVEAIRYNPDGGGGAAPGVLVRKQIPLKLAWATTVHKSQGSTLTRAILDISKTFEPGQAYVSLSRVKSIDGLFLERPVSMENILVSQRVLDYYRSKII